MRITVRIPAQIEQNRTSLVRHLQEVLAKPDRITITSFKCRFNVEEKIPDDLPTCWNSEWLEQWVRFRGHLESSQASSGVSQKAYNRVVSSSFPRKATSKPRVYCECPSVGGECRRYTSMFLFSSFTLSKSARSSLRTSSFFSSSLQPFNHSSPAVNLSTTLIAKSHNPLAFAQYRRSTV